MLVDARHFEAVQADEAAKVLLHPLFLLAPQYMTTQSVEGAADVSSYALNPGRSARPEKLTYLGAGPERPAGS